MRREQRREIAVAVLGADALGKRGVSLGGAGRQCGRHGQRKFLPLALSGRTQRLRA